MNAKQLVYCITLGFLSLCYGISSFDGMLSSSETLNENIAKTEQELVNYTAYHKSLMEANNTYLADSRLKNILELQNKLSDYKIKLERVSAENTAAQPDNSRTILLGAMLVVITGGLVVTLVPKVKRVCQLLAPEVKDYYQKSIGVLKKSPGHLTQIPKKPQTFGVDPGVEEVNDELINKVCLEVVTDTLDRRLNENEQVQVIKSLRLEDGSVFTVFRYRQHSRIRKESGSFDDKVFASVHAITIHLNRIGDYINVSGVISLDAKDFEHYANPQALISDLLSRSLISPEVPLKKGEVESWSKNSDARAVVTA
jgi:hypothetical protein